MKKTYGGDVKNVALVALDLIRKIEKGIFDEDIAEDARVLKENLKQIGLNDAALADNSAISDGLALITQNRHLDEKAIDCLDEAARRLDSAASVATFICVLDDCVDPQIEGPFSFEDEVISKIREMAVAGDFHPGRDPIFLIEAELARDGIRLCALSYSNKKMEEVLKDICVES